MNIKNLLEELTLEEKLGLICGADNWGNAGAERLGIKRFTFVDGPQGVRKLTNKNIDEYETAPATCFPTPSAMGCTWNTELAEEVAEALGEETAEHGRQAVNTPGINIKRIPICGRNFEYISEDPVLSGEMGAAVIKGLQKKGISPTLKHYALNNQESSRHFVSAQLDKRTLREIYLAGFERAVKKGKINHLPCKLPECQPMIVIKPSQCQRYNKRGCHITAQSNPDFFIQKQDNPSSYAQCQCRKQKLFCCKS